MWAPASSIVGPDLSGCLFRLLRPLHRDRAASAVYRVDVRIEKKWSFLDGKWLSATAECFNLLRKAEPVGADYSSVRG